ncbi:restriction endonuclease [Hymenobacter perfusus]|uniref:Restriction endonuclease n=1 Tax=Hymenobacter perfusus TaxID=1236770 RepID=A0A428JXJ9_9BACT|nr:restriction endonuclease [Hymenobacter perfusus]RSK38932.1 restriction endonuclease [Hymenobacter perfusus]
MTRIALFDNWIPFHIGNEVKHPLVDNPINWSEFTSSPNFKLVYDEGNHQEYRLEDRRAIDEIHRLLKFQTCPICRAQMAARERDFNESLFVCLRCGFWGGRGSRMDNVHEGIPFRGVLGFYKPLKPLQELSTEYLVTHLKRFPDALPKIGPKRAEKFVMDLLSDYLNCEVKPIGGFKDKGVDGYIIKGDEISSIVQIKWRENVKGAESVKVIREVAGTLLARGVPSGILVSNKDHFSKDAISDANSISNITIEKLGKMELQLIDYHNIIDMLDISNTLLTDNMKINDWIDIENAYDVFEGAMRLHEDFVKMFK